MKLNLYRFTFSFVFLFLLVSLSACTTQPPTLFPLPTADVPPIADLDEAIAKWENGNNTNYFVTVEETNHLGTFQYRIVIADGDIRAAQQLTQGEGGWGAPVALDFETAQNYTIDALIERVRNDALGLGVVPMDMDVIFDPLSGFPSVVEAKALPTYNEAGNLELNRDLGYTFSSDVKILIEDTISQSKQPVLLMTRSGGEQAWCDTLRIYPDGSSIFTDDCRQTLLQLTPPATKLNQVLEIAAAWSGIDETKEEAGVIEHLILYGTGTGNPDSETLAATWQVGRELADLLSRPIGAGITLLYTQHSQLFGYDMRTSLGQPATVDVSLPLHGMITNPDGSLLAYSDMEGVRWLDLLTGDSGLFIPNPPDGHYRLRAWNTLGILLLQRIAGDTTPEWGWTSQDDPSWHPLALPAGAFACDTGVSMNPTSNEVVISAGGECQTDPGLTLVNINDGGTRKLIDAQGVPGSGAFSPAWSPDGNWIVFSLSLMDTPENPQRIYLIRSDGTEMTALTQNTTGQASHPIWSHDGTQIFYALNGADTGEDGIYMSDLSGQVSLIFAESNIHPVSISPSDEFLVFSSGTEMKAYLLTLRELYPIARGTENVEVFFVGWLDERTGR